LGLTIELEGLERNGLTQNHLHLFQLLCISSHKGDRFCQCHLHLGGCHFSEANLIFPGDKNRRIQETQKAPNYTHPNKHTHTHTHTHPKLSELLWHIPHDKVEKTPALKLGIKEFSSTLVGGAAGFRAQMNFR